ncbi:short-chain dehydrogenase, putative [Talaromyces stipitatus ATCC 10500]|uniref:Short-chain dehydrogenase, putative n=1 Tax=Talaromyces stipitatus (strain ATCC 10500 / CBS 375.48 / QM 6759 / NRRL 1006) TaxID=441959 RepID=B8LVT7_TALSN|nr:short-chain dehydrogenase, putative [Talaromyces stipitatus ATCC 10500]EED24217.1 short-chain dehydrogenase, putative [Talaromyces stipitatus ATCC 10500]
MGGQLGFLYRQLTFKPKPIPSSVRLDGKTAIITGANVGLGLKASRELAAHGLTRLILAARNVSKGEAAKKVILEQSPTCDVQVWELDYESFESIRSFGERAQTLDRLDIVILSAGVKSIISAPPPSPFSFSPLQATARSTGTPSRLTIVTSEVHFWTDFNEQKASNIIEELDNPSSSKKGSMDRYNVSKLLDLLWLRELSTKVGSDVTVNGVNPGLCASALHRSHEGSSGFNKVFASPEGQETQQRLFQETLSVLSDALSGVDLMRDNYSNPTIFRLSSHKLFAASSSYAYSTYPGLTGPLLSSAGGLTCTLSKNFPPIPSHSLPTAANQARIHGRSVQALGSETVLDLSRRIDVGDS